ncbi:piggyBac transposable element-derived protein 4-like, partial [Scomber scombrus]
VTSTYYCQRKTARWPMVVFFKMLDVSAYNAFVLWMEDNPRWKQGKYFKRRLFLEDLGKAMLAPYIQQRQHLPRTPASAGL